MEGYIIIKNLHLASPSGAGEIQGQISNSAAGDADSGSKYSSAMETPPLNEDEHETGPKDGTCCGGYIACMHACIHCISYRL